MTIKVIQVGENILKANKAIAEENRKRLNDHSILSFNVMGAPGAGKTELLDALIEKILPHKKVGVIEGDIAGSYDSERLSHHSIPLVQINTAGACHLEAFMIQQGLDSLPLSSLDILFVENVGNLVCPAEFELGIKMNIVVASPLEGDDKPAKYPLMYKISHACALSKMDLAEYVSFDKKRFSDFVKEISPDIRLFPLSPISGEGISDFSDWILAQSP
ncbi:MAG: hydrogenase nickel incorporation protein HypB [Candidatus Ratteibacteria bacterium]